MLLDHTTTSKLIHAFVTSMMDYCNSPMLGLPTRKIRKMQIIHNSAARLATKTKKYDHITPILQGLHWLPVRQCVNLRLICTTYTIIYGAVPTYFNDLQSIYTPSRNLHIHSTGEVRLNQPIPYNKFYGERDFSICAASLEQLTSGITFDSFLLTLKVKSKTHLFNEYYFT